jgi:outer membrane biogenesis lipoprotein LolB
METKNGIFVAAILCAVLSACATPGTRVSTDSNFYKEMSRSQQQWCAQFGCDCELDGVKASCPLVASCLNSGSCQKK